MVRSDLQHLIIDTGRYRWGGAPRVRDDDMDAERAPARNRRGSWPGDRLAPLYRYLHKQVGRPWRLVSSELARAFDRRSLRGHHLHSHVADIVVLDRVSKTDQGYRRTDRRHDDGMFLPGQLFVDEHGLLRRPRPHETRTRAAERARRAAEAAALERQRKQARDGVYLRVDGLWWFVVPGDAEFRASSAGHAKVALFDTVRLTFCWQPLSELRRFDDRTWYLPRSKRQVSRRDIRREELQR